MVASFSVHIPFHEPAPEVFGQFLVYLWKYQIWDIFPILIFLYF